MIDHEEQGLRTIANKMSSSQRKEMADMLNAELVSRQSTKEMEARREMGMAKSNVNASSINGGLSRDQVKELYSEVNDAVKQVRMRKLESQPAGRKTKQSKPSERRARLTGAISRRALFAEGFSVGRIGLIGAIVLVAILKVVFSTGQVDATPNSANAQPDGVAADQMIAGMESEKQAELVQAVGVESSAVAKNAQTEPSSRARLKSDANLINSSTGRNWSDGEKELLSHLDARRVELEKREEMIQDKEAEIKAQSQALTERVTELKALTSRVQEARRESDKRYEARLEQLANVYSSMQPSEAAGLIGKLDEQTAVELLERMPGKRMAQVLGVMDQDRAIQLTKNLTVRKVH